MKQVPFFFLALVVLYSCENKRSETRYYFAIDSVLHDQVQYLTVSRATLTKKASIGGENEAKVFVPKDTLAWSHQLDAFAGLNEINKPANAGKYRIEKGRSDINSNLLIYSIESTENLPVEYLKVYYLDNLSNIRKIEGFYHEESSLLKSSRQLLMEFQSINNKIVLTSYSVTGGQKMPLGDTVQYSVTGTITLP